MLERKVKKKKKKRRSGYTAEYACRGRIEAAGKWTGELIVFTCSQRVSVILVIAVIVAAAGSSLWRRWRRHWVVAAISD